MGAAILAVIILAVFAIRLFGMFLGEITKGAKGPEEAYGKIVTVFGFLFIVYQAFQQHSFLSGLVFFGLTFFAFVGFIMFVAPSALESDDKNDGKDEDMSGIREFGLILMLLGLVTVSFFDNSVISIHIAEPWLIFHDSNELRFEAGWVNYFIVLGLSIILLIVRGVFSTIFKKGAAIIYYASLMGFSWWFFGFQQVFAKWWVVLV